MSEKKVAGTPGLRVSDTGRVKLAGYEIERLALGAMRLVSSSYERDGRPYECHGLPADPEANRRVMRAAYEEYGIGYIDLSHGYGPTPDSGETFFRDWMAPYPPGLLWATKVGYARDANDDWMLDLAPATIASQIAASIAIVGEKIPLLYLVVNSTLDVSVHNRPKRLADSFKPLMDVRDRGVAQHLGVANVTADELKELLDVTPIAAVQNKFTVESLSDPKQLAVLELCRKHDIRFVAWGIFQSDTALPWEPGPVLLATAAEMGVSPHDASLAIVLQAEPKLIALTGATRRASLEASIRATKLAVPDDLMRRFFVKDAR